ncbi:MAG: family acetyltransferase [Gemmatimonadetes bacterium]|nr:family acetyltransferase [Gemmatimonadota bacterium]
MTVDGGGAPATPGEVAEERRGEYEVSTDPARLDVPAVHAYLTRSYWAEGIPIETVRRSIAGSLPFGLYADGVQVGFARVVTDRATFAYLADVYVLEEHRGAGLGVWLVDFIMRHPDLQGLRRWSLATRDAHDLYRKFGWTELKSPDRWMERHFPDVYAMNP